MARKKEVGKQKDTMNIPVKKDDLVTLKIESIGAEGEGVGKVAGYTLFVKDAVAGDVISAKVIKTKKQFGYARLIEIVEPSKDRVEPVCPVAKQCGGCQIQQVSYKKQLEYKENKVLDCFKRIGGFQNIVKVGEKDTFDIEKNESNKVIYMEPIMGMNDPYYYRNKAQFPIGINKDGEIVSGFYAGRTHTIINQEKCYIGATINELILKTIKEFMKEFHIKTYDEESHKGLIRHVLTRIGFVTGEVMVCLVMNGDKLPHSDILLERLSAISEPVQGTVEGICVAKVRKVTSICINVNKEKTNVILGSKIIPLYNEPYIRDFIGEIEYQISPLSFYQVNPVQTKKLYDLTLEYAELTGNEVVWDLYCGIGTISLFLAKAAKEVYGVEIIPQAIEDAKYNAKLNGIENAKFFVGAAEDVLPEQYEKNKVYADVIVVDPPRKGCDIVLLETIVKMQPKRVVYVSCDPATLARDAKMLSENGYRVTKFRAVDQFSHSTHVESVCQFVRL